MPFQYHEELELRVERLSERGEGVAFERGCEVVVPLALVGEMVRVRVYHLKGAVAQADLREVLEPSPLRIEPRCGLFGRCSGCQLQHLPYHEQLRWKTERLNDLWKAWDGVKIEPMIGSPLQYGYRSKITPHCLRPKQGREMTLGFRQFGRQSPVDMKSCPIASPALNERWSVWREEILKNPPPKGATFILRLSDEGVVTDQRARVTQTVAGLSMEFTAGSFFQNNPSILPAVTDYVRNQVRHAGVRYLVDAYCGCGFFGIACSDLVEQVLGIEINSASVATAQSNAERNHRANLKFIQGDAEQIFEHIQTPAEETMVLIDPPRAGCSPSFLKQLLDYAPSHVLYVSCNPHSQQRDAQVLAPYYEVKQLQPFDFFPQTFHFECVAVMERKRV